MIFHKKEEIESKRTKSDINDKVINSNSLKENIIKSLKKGENKNTIYNKEKKYTNLNSILILNSKKHNISPRKAKFFVNNKAKIKDFSEKNISSLKTKNLNLKKKYNCSNLNPYLEKMIRETKISNKINKFQKEIKINDIISEKIKRNCTLRKKEFKDNSKIH